MFSKLWIFLTTVDASDNRNIMKLTVWLAIIISGIHYISKFLF